MRAVVGLVNAAETDFVMGESRGLLADTSVNGALSTTIWISNRHGRVFWAGARNIYTPEFAARIGGGMTGDADEFALGWLKAIGQGKAGGSSNK
jgi:hypothetical protein